MLLHIWGLTGHVILTCKSKPLEQINMLLITKYFTAWNSANTKSTFAGKKCLYPSISSDSIKGNSWQKYLSWNIYTYLTKNHNNTCIINEIKWK